MDTYQLRWIFFRRRDQYGRLIRYDPDLPAWVQETTDAEGRRVVPEHLRSSYAQMWVGLQIERGATEDEAVAEWNRRRLATPNLLTGQVGNSQIPTDGSMPDGCVKMETTWSL